MASVDAIAIADDPSRLVQEREIAERATSLLDRIAEAKTRSCPRTVLRGAPATGDAAPSLLALTEPTGALAEAATKLVEIVAGRVIRDVIASGDPRLRALDESHGAAIEEAVTRAARFANRCSPYQIGVRKAPQIGPILRLTHVMTVRARNLAERGSKDQALWLLLETVNVASDVARGRIGLTLAALGMAPTSFVAPHLAAIANGAALDARTLDELAKAVDTMLAEQPPVTDSLLGERDQLELYNALLPLQPDTWIPPGGLPDDASRSAPPGYFEPRDAAAILFYFSAALSRKLVDACPAGASLKQCHDGLTRLQRSLQPLPDRYARMRALREEIESVTLADDVRQKARDKVVDLMVNEADLEVHASMGARQATPLAALASFRFHLEVLRTIAATGHCPTRQQLDEPPYATLAAPALLGDRLVIRQTRRSIVLTPPKWTRKPEPYTIACPR